LLLPRVKVKTVVAVSLHRNFSHRKNQTLLKST